ncbi:meprin A subunit beta-like isoform X1 [Clupea harengus]|uniref:Meprin A subunit beta-like isoform X1 n=1 Tax=Clupea harengus TaxID=7950 RepID=A0A8M1KRC7_CLUHA|nr:meprin A subunit beta-like isoform X1 [Clupea harengus]
MHPCVFLLVSLACGLASSLPHPIVKDEDIDITEINKGLDLFEGDIKVAAKTRRRRSIRSEPHRWPLPIPYYLDWSLDINAKGVILRALDQFRLKTCIDFRPRRWGEQHIALKKDTGCWSHVGKEKWKQDLSIGPNCDTVATVEHELMHALGFWHEQSRYDRDNYITINWENIEAGKEHNFKIRTNDTNSTMDTPYDYFSVMHYSKDAFTNGNGSTIITKLPEFQDVIGQRLDMSHYDVEELNKFYGCNESISFLDHCSFDDESLCEMSVCSRRSRGWRRVSRAKRGPHSDHTYLGTGSQGTGFFMHFSTKRGTVGDSARLQTRRMTPRRSCKIQCLEFFYYHSGSWSDQLNIWIREFDDVDDIIGTRRLMSQIQGSPADYWKLHHVPLNATKTFQVEFEARKGAGASSGGFSVDDINLSETECPHHTWQIRNFEEALKNSVQTPFLFSPKYYSIDGYRFQIMLQMMEDHFGAFVRLVSGTNDDKLQWPCPWRQVTILALDQNAHIQHRMSGQISLTTDPTELGRKGFFWDNPRHVGASDETPERDYATPERDYATPERDYVTDGRGYGLFMTHKELRSREFLKGGDMFFLISMHDISSLEHSQSLPCPNMPQQTFTAVSQDPDQGCLST